jgi:hypothetical protein
MGINRTLLTAVTPQLRLYDCEDVGIADFLVGGWRFPRRQKEAGAIIQMIMHRHGKAGLAKHIAALAKVEKGIRLLQPAQRDHVVHALLSFILGIHINEAFMRNRGCAVGPLQWKLAGLFHDIGYPAQVASKVLSPIADRIKAMAQDLGLRPPDISFQVHPVGFDRLTDRRHSLALIQSKFVEWGLKVDALTELNKMIGAGKVRHGIVSALSVLCAIDLLYKKFNDKRVRGPTFDDEGRDWDQKYFEQDVVPACAAIFLHDLPPESFAGTPIRKEKAPLAFLLRLADTLQDWERPSGRNSRGVSNRKFDIRIRSDYFEFFVASKSRRQNLLAELKACLDTAYIRVRPNTVRHDARIWRRP